MKKIYLSFLLSGIAVGASAQWALTESMSETRTQHVAVVMGTDSLLVAGGYDFSNNLTTAQVYLKASDTWESTSNNMSSAHTTAAAVRLQSGKVLVIAGWDGSINTTVCDLYNPATNSWSPAGYMSYGRSYHTATLLNDGRVLVTGGYTGAVNTPVCEIYDPVMGTWSQTDSLATGRSYHTATKLGDGRVLVTGGYNPAAGFQLSSCEIFDPATDTWSAAGSMDDARAWHAASLTATGGVMVTGGEYFTGGTPFAYEGLKTVEIYDTTTNTWTASTDMPGGLCYHQQFAIGPYTVAIAGLANTDYGTGFTSAPGETYMGYTIGSATVWVDMPMNIDARIQYAAAQFPSQQIMVTGGDDNSAEMYTQFVGVNENKEEVEFIVYPNPGQGIFNINAGDAIIRNVIVRDLSGKTVLTKENINMQNYVADLSGMNAGLYTVQVNTDNGTAVQKITLIK